MRLVVKCDVSSIRILGAAPDGQTCESSTEQDQM